MSQELLPVKKLIKIVRSELFKVNYSKERVSKYESIWVALIKYMKKRSFKHFDMKIGLNFLEDEYCITVFKKLKSSNGIKVRAVNMLGEFQLHGTILSKKRNLGKKYYKAVRNEFDSFIFTRKQNGISEKTLMCNELYLSRFSEYLSKIKLINISDLDSRSILGFVNTLAGSSESTIRNTLGTLRILCKYLYKKGIVKKDYSYIVPKIKIDKTSRIPSAYSKDEVKKLLNSVDRGNPKGKRDYAMLLLAARLGMRAGDICGLTFKNVKWNKNEIVLVQKKTGEKNMLPLLPEVGSSIIDYLKYGRPETESSNVFVRHVCPIGRLSTSTLHSIVWNYMQIAGITIPDGKKHGPHALRHSLASVLLEENTPLPVISEILGHTNTDSTTIYLKIDVNQLRRCSLDVSAFAWNQIIDKEAAHVL